ncbi:MAG: hypothetical protein R3332_04925 [Pseudohongiellaceae bacterium]|nr:hypothetical protein [Pseudohongiellaceae bacterium]
MQELKRFGFDIRVFCEPKVFRTLRPSERVDFNPLYFSISDLICSLTLLVLKGWSLYRRLGKGNRLRSEMFFDRFCLSYSYLSFFYRNISYIRPSCVLTANDHNVQNRCFIAIANYLDCRTAYLQHASVSKFFPALSVDWAFLDGKASEEIYVKCQTNRPDRASRKFVSIFHTGQKKILTTSDRGNTSIGLAVNAFIDLETIESVYNLTLFFGYKLHLRWHPTQESVDIEQLKRKYGSRDSVILSDPSKEDVASYLSRLRYLVAGNSSIHLEAALAGVVPLYFETSDFVSWDYYGYVKKGISFDLQNLETLRDILNEKVKVELSLESLRYYSATYQTVWQNREGELVAKLLVRLCHGGSFTSASEVQYQNNTRIISLESMDI